jgi:hypothetical protein
MGMWGDDRRAEWLRRACVKVAGVTPAAANRTRGAPMISTNYDLSSVLLGLLAVLPLGLGALYILARAEKRRMPKWNAWQKTGQLR